jgi:predicted nucleic acid-binding protein
VVTVGDTSVVVPALVPSHPFHAAAASALEDTTDVVAHTLLEAYATLTRLPEPARVPPAVAATLLERRFSGKVLTLPASEHRRLLRALAGGGVRGAATHDALIAATARHAGARLVSLDRRALPTYAAVGADVSLLAPRT